MRRVIGFLLPVCALGALALWLQVSPARAASSEAAEPVEEPRMPSYDGEGNLLLPGDHLRWVFVGSSLGLSYSAEPQGQEMFHHTLMEPSAHRHFSRTGEFRDGTMFVLLLHGTGEGVLPSRQGRFAAEIQGVEMSVKDLERSGGWAYYAFGGRGGIRDQARAFASSACNDCHVEHAASDNVFLQFYPLLAQAAPTGTVAASASSAAPAQEQEASAQRSDPPPPLALLGLDPVLLVEGREEMGKPEIVMAVGEYRHRFVSEPTRARFEQEPERYAIQNDTCPVVPGAPVAPDLFAVHEGKIYAFATEGCVTAFVESPGAYLTGD